LDADEYDSQESLVESLEVELAIAEDEEEDTQYIREALDEARSLLPQGPKQSA
jgi:hypothetical protein